MPTAAPSEPSHNLYLAIVISVLRGETCFNDSGSSVCIWETFILSPFSVMITGAFLGFCYSLNWYCGVSTEFYQFLTLFNFISAELYFSQCFSLSCLISYLIFWVSFWKMAAAGSRCGVLRGPLFWHWRFVGTHPLLLQSLLLASSWFGWLFFSFVIYFSVFIEDVWFNTRWQWWKLHDWTH